MEYVQHKERKQNVKSHESRRKVKGEQKDKGGKKWEIVFWGFVQKERVMVGIVAKWD